VVEAYGDPSYIFSGGQVPLNPTIYAPAKFGRSRSNGTSLHGDPREKLGPCVPSQERDIVILFLSVSPARRRIVSHKLSS